MSPCPSPCNTPILPVRKPHGQGWHFVQDLQAINNTVIPCHPVVPNPHTILKLIPPNTQFFTVRDLCSTFFSIPVHPDSQYLFAFMWEGHQFTWTVMPQSYTESPTYFSQILRQDLANLYFARGSTLLQYGDDLLLCFPH